MVRPLAEVLAVKPTSSRSSCSRSGMASAIEEPAGFEQGLDPTHEVLLGNVQPVRKLVGGDVTGIG